VLLEPATTAEVAASIAYYHEKSLRGVPVTLRASRPFFHSSTKFACPSRPGGSAEPSDDGSAVQPVSVAVLQTRLNKVLAVDRKAWTIRVQPGMRFTELLKEATNLGMSVQVR
jgi:FAD/FMN-containing dehydrogenase